MKSLVQKVDVRHNKMVDRYEITIYQMTIYLVSFNGTVFLTIITDIALTEVTNE